MARSLGVIATVLGLFGLAFVAATWILFGGGRPYDELAGAPRLPEGTMEVAVTSDRPIGNAAVGSDGRVFYTVHPESRPEPPYVYVAQDGDVRPFPDEAAQRALFQTPLGVVVQGGRLWVIDPGRHGFGNPSLTVLDATTGEVLLRHDFDVEVAPWGSFLQDLQVSADGRWAFIADAGFWAKRPALIVFDAQTGTARRVLSRHAAFYPQNWLIRNQIRDMSFFGGIIEMKTGLDGIALSRDGAWLYLAAMNHDTLYRLPTQALTDGEPEEEIAAKIEAVGRKPLNDGLSTDDAGGVFITDIEHQAVLRMTPDGALETVVRDSRIRWADGLSFGPDGWLYLADSAIPELVLQDAAHHAAAAPYHIWRFRPGTAGAPGQ
jgi:hypothetical protein